MAFANDITTIYLPAAANAGSSLWGTDVRKVLSSADATQDGTTQTNQGTGTTAVVRTLDPYTNSTTDAAQDAYGWAIQPSDMGSTTAAKRMIPAGDHTLTIVESDSVAVGTTVTLNMYVYRVSSAASGRTRTLLGSGNVAYNSGTASIAVTVTCTTTLPEILFGDDETIQYSWEASAAGAVITGRTLTWFTGTHSGATAIRIAIPGLKTIADTVGSGSGVATQSGVTGKVLAQVGTGSGVATQSGVTGKVLGRVATGTGAGVSSGVVSTVKGTVGSVPSVMATSWTGASHDSTSVKDGVVNLLTNPSKELDTVTGYDVWHGNTSPTGGIAGERCWTATTLNTGMVVNNVGVGSAAASISAGTYTFGIWVYLNCPIDATVSVQPWSLNSPAYNSGGSGGSATAHVIAANTTSWQFLTGTGSLQAGYAGGQVSFSLASTQAVDLRLDAAILVTGSVLTNYFDGSGHLDTATKVWTPTLSMVTGSGGKVLGLVGSGSGTGTPNGVTGKILAQIGSGSGTGTAVGNTSKVLAQVGAGSGSGASTGRLGATSSVAGSGSGTGTSAGRASSVAGTPGTASGVGDPSGKIGKVLGTAGSVVVSEGGGETVVRKLVVLLDD